MNQQSKGRAIIFAAFILYGLLTGGAHGFWELTVELLRFCWPGLLVGCVVLVAVRAGRR